MTTLSEQRRDLIRKWNRLLSEVRTIDGFADFLRTPSLAEILPMESDSPVAVLNVAERRVDAIIVRPSGVEVVPLPEVHAGLLHYAAVYIDAVAEREEVAGTYQNTRARFMGGDRSVESFHDYQRAKERMITAQPGIERSVGGVLRWLWDSLAEPVLQALADPERLWLCPTGLLTALPLHAAGYHTDGRSLLDRTVTSYTPTLRALRRAQDRTRAERPDGPLLIVEVADADGAVPLPDTIEETARLAERFAGRCTVLRGDAATREAVRANLRLHSRVHFSCHGIHRLGAPSEGGLLLRDGILSLRELAAQEFDGDFAYVSTCKSALGGPEHTEEVMTFASVLNHLGFAHVIGTLWSVYDSSARQVSEGIYERLTDTGTLKPHMAATALTETLRELRHRNPDRPTTWIPFTHTGP